MKQNPIKTLLERYLMQLMLSKVNERASASLRMFLVGAFLKKRARLLQSLVFFYLRQTRSDER